MSGDIYYTANVYTQTTDLLLFSDVVITHENVLKVYKWLTLKITDRYLCFLLIIQNYIQTTDI